MNKIYKVIWSKVRNCYVVVSEMAKRNGKCSSSLNKKIIASFLAAGLVAAIIPKDAEAWYIMANNSTIVIAGQGPVYNRVGGSGDRLGTVWGSNTSAEAAWATAFGSNTVASSTNATAWGNGARATGNHATAFGGGTEASNYRATAWGNSTIASGSDSTAWGTETQATKTNATAFGSGTVAASDAATAWGRKAQATGQYSTAWGFDTSATAQNATAFGQETQATANRATAFGIETTASGKNSTSFGYKTQAVGENSTAWGSNTQAVGGGATAFGAYTEARAENSVTWGNHSIVFGGEVTVGGQKYTDLETLRYNGTNQYYLTGKDENGNIVRLGGIDGDTEIIADGFIYTTGAADAWEGNDEEGRGKVDDWIISPAGGKGEVAGQYSTAFGERSRVHARNALGALGGTVQAGAHNSAAIGVGSDVSSEDSYAMGNGATIGTGSAGSVALGGFIGSGATNSFAAIGGTVDNSATNAIAIGGSVSASAVSAIAIGQGSSAVQSRATALGQGATASLQNSVALGSSTTTQAGVVATTGIVGGITYGGWANTLSDTNKVVSVGNRQINQVAAGQVSTSSTDAVNGSQLYAAYDQLQWNIVTSGNEKGTALNHTIGKLTPTGTRQNLELKAGTGITFNSTASGVANRIVEIRSNFDTATLGSDGKIKSITYFDGTEYVTKEIGGGYGIFDANVGGRKTNQFGSTISVVGEGAKPISEYSGKNVKTVIEQDPDGNSTITVKIDENPSFTSVTTGDTKIDNNGLTILNGGPFGNVAISKTKIDMGGNQIHNVAPGTNDEDAVNMSQLNDLIGGGSGNYGLRVGDTKGTTIGQWLNNSVFSVKGGEGAEAPASPSGYSARNITTRLVPDGSGNNSIYIQMSEAPEFKGSTGKSVKISGPEGSVTASNGAQTSMITPEGLTISGAQHIVIQQGNVDVGGNQIHNVARGTAGTDGVNVSQLNEVKWNIGTGTTTVKYGDGEFGGTNKSGALELTQVGKQADGVDRSNIRFTAGPGIDISHKDLKNGTGEDAKTIGYSIDISSKFQDAKISSDGNGHYIKAITFEGKNYLLAGAGTGTAAPPDVISDNRAVTAELIESKDGDFAIEVVSPYMSLNGLKDENGKPAEIQANEFAQAKGEYAIAIGKRADAEATNTVALGHDADARAENATAIGLNTTANGANSVSIGVAASSSGNRAIVIGTTASQDSTRMVPENATKSYAGSRAAGQASIALGDHARAQSENYTLKITENPELIGTPDYDTNDAIAVGTKAEARATNAIALGGNLSYTDDKGVTSYGDLNGRQAGAIVGDNASSGIAIGGAYGTVKDGTINKEMNAAATYGLRGIAIGTGALVADKDDFKELENVLSDPKYKTAKAEYQKARAEYQDKLNAYNAIKDLPLYDPTLPPGMQISQDDKNQAEYQMNQAEAALKKATQVYSLELKKSIRLQEIDAIAESDAIAIGTQATAQVSDSVALGSNSVTTATDRSGYRTGLSGYDPLQNDTDNDYFRGDDKYKEDDPVWRSTAGALSVGGGTTTVTDEKGKPMDVPVTRRISNVAAGVNDSDAVNVAQLKRATSIKTDSRNTSMGMDKEGNMVVNSPYLNIQGVKAASDYSTIVNRFDSAEEYAQSLENEKTEITSRQDSIKVSQGMIRKNLDKLEANYKAKKITEAAYLAQKGDYEEQWDATVRRLADLDAKLKEKDAEIQNAAVHYQEAKEYTAAQANASGTHSIAIGNKAASGGKDSISIGQNNQVGTAGVMDAETADTELEKEGANSIAIGKDNKITGTKNSDSSTDSIAIGSGNTVTNKESLAMGKGNTVSGEQSIAIGTGHTVKGNRSGAIGDPSAIDTDDSWAIGNTNTITGNQSFILGNNSTADKENTFIIGSNVKTTAKDSVFLGNDTAYVGPGTRSAGNRTNYTGDTFNGKTYKYAGGNETTGVVSVGNGTQTRRIQNVAPGLVAEGSTDAINGSQLHSAIMNAEQNANNVANHLGNQISGVENRMKKGLAGAAALAALHPMDFDPDDKLTFAAGMGHYRGESAAALGMFYRPDEKVMFSVGGTLGNGENMVNAGVSFSLDRTSRVTGSRTALTKEVVQLREHVAKQDAQIAELTALVRQLAGNAGLQVPASSALPTEGPALFADNLDNKWVYDAIEDLEQRGYFTGYAGRALTRQQIAAALDMAMSGGAKLDERIVKEFEPELSHVRVAHVEGKGNEEGEWYERPRASHDKYEDKHKI
ncbi:MAG: ESPR-type extended signal peptide-containing protein, partial [Succiniclasticum sp.]|uniref:ESPR-type extended signal peptide-containing protein n=1 Tax=Succiniclasticum sp. TaxID=2775030 RepID=UPI002A90CDB5